MILFCIICGVLILGAGLFAYSAERGMWTRSTAALSAICWALLAAMGIIPSVMAVAAWNGGVEPNYSRGYIVGTIIRAENTGVIADTCEITIQQGAGEYRDTIDVSAPKCAGLGIEVGAEVMIDYSGYWIPDLRKGWSGRYVNRIMQAPKSCSL